MQIKFGAWYSDKHVALPAVATSERQHVTGSHALLEVAVKTGLSLLFALLRQSWYYSQLPGEFSFSLMMFYLTISVLMLLLFHF